MWPRMCGPAGWWTGGPTAAARACTCPARSALGLESSGPEFEFDSRGRVAGVSPAAQTEAHRLIEHLMITANEQVAGLLESRRVPALYRVHEPPDADSVERLIEQLASLGVPTPPAPRGAIAPQQAGELVGEVSQEVGQWLTQRGHGRRGLT